MALLHALSRQTFQKCTQRSLVKYKQQQHLKNKFFSTTTTPPPSSSSSDPISIISRRAYNHHLPTNPRLNPSSTTNKSSTSSSSTTEEKPWPTSMKVGAAIATALIIPYTIGTLIASSQSLRDVLEGERPDIEEDSSYGKALVEFVRNYWGEDEVQPYVDALPLLNAQLLGKAEQDKLYILEGEDTSKERMQQKEICAMNHSNMKVRITLQGGDTKSGGGSGGGICAERILEGVTPVNVQSMRDAVISRSDDEDVNLDSGAEDNGGEGMKVSLDFANFDIVNDEIKNDEEVMSMGGDNELDAMNDGGSMGLKKEGQKIREMTPIYSTWNHFPSVSSSSSSSSSTTSSSSTKSTSSTSTTTTTTTTLSNKDIRIAELEWNIKELNAQLSDPNCTRDIDDMRSELKESKRELRKLKGGWLGGLWK